jgi:hypothetical protein
MQQEARSRRGCVGPAWPSVVCDYARIFFYFSSFSKTSYVLTSERLNSNFRPLAITVRSGGSRGPVTPTHCVRFQVGPGPQGVLLHILSVTNSRRVRLAARDPLGDQGRSQRGPTRVMASPMAVAYTYIFCIDYIYIY